MDVSAACWEWLLTWKGCQIRTGKRRCFHLMLVLESPGLRNNLGPQCRILKMPFILGVEKVYWAGGRRGLYRQRNIWLGICWFSIGAGCWESICLGACIWWIWKCHSCSWYYCSCYCWWRLTTASFLAPTISIYREATTNTRSSPDKSIPTVILD